MNIQALMQQAQAMQKQVEQNVESAKKTLAQKEVQGQAGNGLVKVTMTGRHVVKRLSIDPSLMSDEPDMIEDLVAAAINDAVRQADELHEEIMAGATTGMGLPKGMQGLFG
ncbi:YbaB/EbfC family nucleoid-associated protein [Moraxella nonliquefaciens]|uniref:Nucleoid-associated protein A7456_05425 n=1 Tax=Moraxella nonliquefaciens TaxID=478 RepID=A0A1B8QJ66_MORNO|nr:YbaB/EbfC family nucleoid-associated protein [Moraxella nonliquefaciens]MCG7412850.1 YbaB/EbfC family nucleoid-associated protein [Moraxella nonliquefaciens]MDI4497487.1 YbaB/EbfC family nucleoid-associated protein [Moraxella nonliquefaciens]MDI4499422.1 YbaB/EbfC family nucleoid-associated protein [Moraxella nonliquefaciens]OBX49227.1 nucleoid-associated protein [Moraxella nonliquefaciens]OBX52418.1 nucleoid-associated protein [Moraxella nonliquefaciens]